MQEDKTADKYTRPRFIEETDLRADLSNLQEWAKAVSEKAALAGYTVGRVTIDKISNPTRAIFEAWKSKKVDNDAPPCWSEKPKNKKPKFRRQMDIGE